MVAPADNRMPLRNCHHIADNLLRQLDTPEFEKVSTQEERKTFVEKLDEACINYLLNSMCKIGFTWTEKMVTNLGEVPLRSKKKIASPSAVSEDWKSDDLKIFFVGVLYSGYWSSSRVKDRFPYPVGYKTVRAHNGSTYYMEIEEGAKGPLFLVCC
ncbi:hypothetical protein Bca101_036045 [Brassica carinata]